MLDAIGTVLEGWDDNQNCDDEVGSGEPPQFQDLQLARNKAARGSVLPQLVEESCLTDL